MYAGKEGKSGIEVSVELFLRELGLEADENLSQMQALDTDTHNSVSALLRTESGWKKLVELAKYIETERTILAKQTVLELQKPEERELPAIQAAA